jgi:N,N'-diacetyllegionaminate synthase
MVRRYELDRVAHEKIAAYCKKKNIMFLSTPHDLDSVDLLAELGLEIFKVPSGEVTDLPYLRKIGGLGKKVILSTGMADMAEIRRAFNVLVKAGTRKDDITVLQCTTNYPAKFSDANLLAMCAIRDALKVKVGYSDHTVGIEASIAAVAMGATVIEKHFTLDKGMEGPDHKASVDPSELKALVSAVRNVEKALGRPEKSISDSEKDNIKIVRKSIVASTEIKKGEEFTEQNITVKRPATGISPMEWDMVVGKTAVRDFAKDELIEL